MGDRRDVLRDPVERRVGDQHSQPAHPVAQPYEVAFVGEQPHLDLGGHGRVGRDHPQTTAGERLERRAQQIGLAEVALATPGDVKSEQHHVVAAGANETGGVAHAARHAAYVEAGRTRLRKQGDGQADARMVAQSDPDRQIDDRFGADPRDVARRSDARPHQDAGRRHHPGGEHDLAAPQNALTMRRGRGHRDGTTVLEQHAVNERVAEDRQVLAATDRLEVGVARADARAGEGVAHRGDARGVRRVRVGTPSVAVRQCRLAQRASVAPHSAGGPA